MGDCKTIYLFNDRNEQVIDAARCIVRFLEINENLTEDVNKALNELSTKLSSAILQDEYSKNPTTHYGFSIPELDDIKERFKCAREKILSWDSKETMILWDSGPDISSEYVKVVDDVRQFTEYFRGLSLDDEEGQHDKIICQAESTLQIAMEWLEKEIVYIFLQNGQTVNTCTSSRHSQDLATDAGFSSSSEEGLLLGSPDRESSSNESENYIAHLIPPDAIPVLKSIADVMFAAKYDHEFTEAYTRAQKAALERCLVSLGMESLSIEDLLRIDWRTLESKINEWIEAIRIFVQQYLPAENQLCDQIFGELGTMKSVCFINITQSLMVGLLNFGEAVAIGSRRPEKLSCLLNMYEVLNDLCSDIDGLFSRDAVIRNEFLQLIQMIGDAAKSTFLEYGSFVLSDPSLEPFPAGRVHGLTSYVMNHITTISEYSDTLNLLLREDLELAKMVSQTQNTRWDNINDHANCCFSHHLRSIITNLETNLERKSQLYRECSLRHIFLMNNIHYIVQKVKDSELRVFFGDDWIKSHIVKYQQHAKSYVRVTWGTIVDGLRDEMNTGSDSSSVRNLKERLRNFGYAFEEVYKIQTGWRIQDDQLKEELQISISQRLVLAYQFFVGRCKRYDLDKYIKYDADDLLDHISDLFEGSHKSLNNSRRR